MSLIWNRLFLATTTLPTVQGWLITALLLMAAAVCSHSYGKRSGFLIESSRLPSPLVVRLWLTTWVMPALAEEILFRVFPLPHPNEDKPLTTIAFTALLVLIVFVAGHPLRTLLKPTERNAVFTDMRFLVLATLLGTTCSAAYLATGSLWAPTVLHHTLVVGWLVFFGGWRKVSH